jgi:bifunctional ADP-heptose synthase (sugar kinase/adenylyltransferase)
MDGLNQALIDCVKAAGGSAIVGKKLFPEKSPESAQRHLLDCLNEDRAARLSPEQVVLVLRLAREKGHHGGIAYILADLGYAPTVPIEPKDECAELQRQAAELMASMERVTERLARVMPQATQQLRRAA